MADEEAKAKTKTTTLSEWKARPPSLADIQAKRQKLWDALNEYVRESGGWVTSVPGLPLIRIEAPQGSALRASSWRLAMPSGIAAPAPD